MSAQRRRSKGRSFVKNGRTLKELLEREIQVRGVELMLDCNYCNFVNFMMYDCSFILAFWISSRFWNFPETV